MALIFCGFCVLGAVCYQFGWWTAEYIPDPYTPSGNGKSGFVKAKGGLLEFKLSYDYEINSEYVGSYTSYSDFSPVSDLNDIGIVTIVVLGLCAAVELATFLAFGAYYYKYRHGHKRASSTVYSVWAAVNLVVFFLVLVFLLTFYLMARDKFDRSFTVSYTDKDGANSSIGLKEYLGPHPGFNVWVLGGGLVFPLGIFCLCIFLRKELEDTKDEIQDIERRKSKKKDINTSTSKSRDSKGKVMGASIDTLPSADSGPSCVKPIGKSSPHVQQPVRGVQLDAPSLHSSDEN